MDIQNKVYSLSEFSAIVKDFLGKSCVQTVGHYDNEWLDNNAPGLLAAVYAAHSHNTRVNLFAIFKIRSQNDLISAIADNVESQTDGLLENIDFTNLDTKVFRLGMKSTGFERFAAGFRKNHLEHFAKVVNK